MGFRWVSKKEEQEHKANEVAVLMAGAILNEYERVAGETVSKTILRLRAEKQEKNAKQAKLFEKSLAKAAKKALKGGKNVSISTRK
jgi:hypothetical protein